MYKLYDFLPSGNGYKVRLLLTQLQIPFERIELNILKGETRTPEFLAKNPNGKIPLLEIAPDTYISESNGILYYLSQGTEYFPQQTDVGRAHKTGRRNRYRVRVVSAWLR